MTRRKPGPSHHQRICAWCHAGIAEKRPVFLVRDGGGTIVGPYHAGCAERVVLDAKKRELDDTWYPKGSEVFGRIPREETLPW